MNDSLATCPDIPSEVREFAANKGANGYLNAVIEPARRAFPHERDVLHDVTWHP
jgi:hypothetical protein